MKILVLGLGDAGQMHLRGYRNLGLEVYVSDLDKVKEDAVKDFPVGDIEDDYDYVDVCIPTHKHFDVCKELLKRTNVLVEKPLCLKFDNAFKLVKFAELYGNILGVCHNQLYYPVFDSLSLFGLRYIFVNRSTEETFPEWVYSEGGGIPYEVGYHALYTLFYLSQVTGISQKLFSYESVDDVHSYLFNHGLVVVRNGSKSKDFVDLMLPNGKLRVRPWFNSPSMFPDSFYKFNLYLYLLKNRSMPYSVTHQRVFVDFIKGLRTGVLDYRLSPSLSLDVLKVLDRD